MLAEQINKNMCGVVCPCDETLMEPWLAMTEEELNVYGRTKNPKPSSAGPTETEDADGNAWFIFDTDESKTVKTYLECVKKAAEFFKANRAAEGGLVVEGVLVVVPTEEEKIKAEEDEKAMAEKEKKLETGAKIIGFFEEKYTCTGICSTTLFYVSLSLDSGVPANACLKHV